MTWEELCQISDRFKYLDWRIEIGLSDNQYAWLRWTFYAPDAKGNMRVPQPQLGRKWLIDLIDASEQAVVKTAFLAARQCVEHELCEFFEYDGLRRFDPHKDIL